MCKFFNQNYYPTPGGTVNPEPYDETAPKKTEIRGGDKFEDLDFDVPDVEDAPELDNFDEY
jgi:hypothetical protein